VSVDSDWSYPVSETVKNLSYLLGFEHAPWNASRYEYDIDVLLISGKGNERGTMKQDAAVSGLVAGIAGWLCARSRLRPGLSVAGRSWVINGGGDVAPDTRE
jgi:hypothetical protein